MNYLEDVREFHEKFGHLAPVEFRIMDTAERETRRALICEESFELNEAIRDGDVSQMVHEGVDLLYVVFGMFVNLGIDPKLMWNSVHAANMEKVPNPNGGKPLKPEGWKKPDAVEILRKVGIEL